MISLMKNETGQIGILLFYFYFIFIIWLDSYTICNIDLILTDRVAGVLVPRECEQLRAGVPRLGPHGVQRVLGPGQLRGGGPHLLLQLPHLLRQPGHQHPGVVSGAAHNRYALQHLHIIYTIASDT